MRLCLRFFATLNNFDLSKYNDIFEITLPDSWSWFFMKNQQILLFMQDPIHVATKFRNRLLSKVASLKLGSYSINIQHLFDLINLKNKLDHNLLRSDINPKDRQNFASCVKISSDIVLKLLHDIDEYRGTYVYLSLLRLIISSLIEKSTPIEKRLYQIWTVVFTCRLWRAWIKYLKSPNENTSDSSLSSKQSKRNSFITSQTYWCIEINAHTLLYMILLIINNKLPIDAINTYMFNSQTCENTFRIARSLSGAYSSIINFSVKSFLKKSEKISIVNSIKGGGIHAGAYQFRFPQHHKSHKETYNYTIDPIKNLTLTESDVEQIIERAFESAKEFISFVKMNDFLKETKFDSLSGLSHFTKMDLDRSSRITDYLRNDDEDYDIDSDDENDDDENDDDGNDGVEDRRQNSDGSDDDNDEDDGNVVSNDLGDVEKRTFDGCRIYDKINPQNINKYFRVRIGNSF
ncbi:unnamed protein product, partial [Adineta ricciae]